MNNSMQQMQMQQIQKLAVYDYINEKQIEKAGEVKALQSLFLGT